MNLHEIFLATQLAGGNRDTEYELIDTVNIRESSIAKIERTKEPNGTDYDFYKVVILMTVPIAQLTKGGKINLNNSVPAVWRSDMLLSGSQTFTYVNAGIDGGFFDIYGMYAKTIGDRIAPNRRLDTLFMQGKNIHSITIQLDSLDCSFPIGTTVQIYAKRN